MKLIEAKTTIQDLISLTQGFEIESKSKSKRQIDTYSENLFEQLKKKEIILSKVHGD